MNSPGFRPFRRRAFGRRFVAAAVLLLAAAAPLQAPHPARRILVIGDSQAQGLADGFLRLYLREPAVRVLDRTKIATGLARTAYDWPAVVKKIATTDHADVAVIMFGANDRPNIRPHGKIDAKLAAAFTKAYATEVTSIVTSLRAAHIPVVWVGHPQVRDPLYNEDMAMLNAIFADTAPKAGAEFIPIWSVFASTTGSYDAYGRDTDGETARLRADDGVHFNRTGYDVLARYLQRRVETPGAVASAGK
jgi:hypothetical protein